MNQSRLNSIIETVTGVAIGMVMSVCLSLVIYPMFGHSFTLAQNIWITVIFTVASLIRGYLVRRWFNASIHMAATRSIKGTV